MSRELRVGMMFLLSIAILGTALYFLGSFQELVNYKIKFPKVNGLAVDSPVQFNGVPIGRVTGIAVDEESNPDGQVDIIVTVALHRSLKNHIRTSTVADIRSVGILGDKMILLITKDYGKPILEEGGFIGPASNTLDVDKLLEQGTDMVSDVVEITSDLKLVLEQLAHGDGILQRLIADGEIAENLKNVTGRVSDYLDNDRSLMALLMQDEAFAAQVREKLVAVIDDAAAVGAKYRDAEGLLPMLMKDEEFKARTKAQVSKLLESSAAYVKTLEDSRGLLYTLTQDDAYGDRVSKNLDKASYHLASILEKIDSGEGSASLFLNDPSLFEGLYEIVYGVKHSGITKWYLRKKQKKGEKLLEKEASSKDEGP